MPLSFILKGRAFVPASLALGALLCALPGLADQPAAPAAAPPADTQPGATSPAGASRWHSIALQNTVPGDILKRTHWDQTANLPAGVTRVFALQSNNSLLVQATPAGYAKAREMVTLLDVAPRRVQITFALIHAADAEMKSSGITLDAVPISDLLFLTPSNTYRYATGSGVALFLQTLTKQGAVTQSPVITTTNNVDANFSINTQVQPAGSETTTLAVTPRINSDDSVTLMLRPSFTIGKTVRKIQTTRTVKNGDTMVLALPPTTPTASGKNLLLFVTPVILSTENDLPAVPKK